MKTNNKTRANLWEREASRLLSLWISNLKRKNIFWRTNSSGAKGTLTGEANHAGDITAVDPAGAEFMKWFLIEVKRKKDFDYADISTIRKWINIEGERAKALEKSLFMIIKGRKGILYILTNAKSAKIEKWNIPIPRQEYLFINGYVVYRTPPPMAMKEIDAIVKKVRQGKHGR